MKELAYIEFIISRVQIKPGDTVVLKVPGLISTMGSVSGLEKIEDYRQYCLQYLPKDVGLLLIDKELEIGVLNRESAGAI